MTTVIVLGVAISGCSSSSTPDTASAPTAVSTSTTSFDGSTEPVMVPASGCCEPGSTVLLKSVTIAHVGAIDRITFTFSASVTDYHVRYVALPVKQDPSDGAVELKGDHAIQVSMGATGTDQSTNPSTKTYTGPTRLSLTGGAVIEVVQTGDVEAVSNWAIGVRGQPAFAVSTGVAPSTLVIEVASS